MYVSILASAQFIATKKIGLVVIPYPLVARHLLSYYHRPVNRRTHVHFISSPYLFYVKHRTFRAHAYGRDGFFPPGCEILDD